MAQGRPQAVAIGEDGISADAVDRALVEDPTFFGPAAAGVKTGGNRLTSLALAAVGEDHVQNLLFLVAGDELGAVFRSELPTVGDFSDALVLVIQSRMLMSILQ